MKLMRSRLLRGVGPSFLVMGGAMPGCGSGTPSATKVTSPPGSSAKATLNGLVAMGDEGFNTNPSRTPNNDLADPILNPNVYVAAVILVTWTETPLDDTFNTFTALDSGTPVSDSAFTIQVMEAWRASLGTARGVIANHGLQPTLTPDALAIYPEFTALGPPIEFQSYGPTVDWDETVAVAVSYKTTELEIWTTTQAGGQAVISLAQLQTYAGEI